MAKLLFTIENLDLDHVPFSDRFAILTSSSRNRWANHREAVISDPINLAALKAIENCLLIVCLDEPQQNLSDEKLSQKNMFRQMMDGLGPLQNGSNRWFDKTIQVHIYHLLQAMIIFYPSLVHRWCARGTEFREFVMNTRSQRE